jgi:hypothetical protein
VSGPAVTSPPRTAARARIPLSPKPAGLTPWLTLTLGLGLGLPWLRLALWLAAALWLAL